MKSPPITHTAMMPLKYGTSRAMAAGTKKIPEPITEPTTTQNAATGPNTRGSLADCRSIVSNSVMEIVSALRKGDEVVRLMGQFAEFPRYLTAAWTASRAVWAASRADWSAVVARLIRSTVRATSPARRAG